MHPPAISYTRKVRMSLLSENGHGLVAGPPQFSQVEVLEYNIQHTTTILLVLPTRASTTTVEQCWRNNDNNNNNGIPFDDWIGRIIHTISLVTSYPCRPLVTGWSLGHPFAAIAQNQRMGFGPSVRIPRVIIEKKRRRNEEEEILLVLLL